MTEGLDRLSPRWVERPDHLAWLREQARRQMRFGRRFPHPSGGAWYLDEHGVPDEAQPVHTWVTARMLHVYSLLHLAGLPGARPLAEQALAGLTGRLRDQDHGGWYAAIGPDGEPDGTKAAYAHAFVVLGASSAAVAELPGADAVLEASLGTLDERFWEDGPGLHADSAPADWSRLGDYRGVNANMHAVEALLSAADTTGEDRWLERAARITGTVLGWAEGNRWRVPEHFTRDWEPMLGHHLDQPDHPFEPYGATVGHGLEWSRLAVHVAAALDAATPGTDRPRPRFEVIPPADPRAPGSNREATVGAAASSDLYAAARALFERAVTDGWAVDGADGFVYTTDWDGHPVVRQRMHWVLAEAISAAGALADATGDPAYEDWYRTWWDHAVSVVIADDGSWRHELDPANEPAATVWPGRPDLYHSLHAVLLPRLLLAPSAPTAIARGLLR